MSNKIVRVASEVETYKKGPFDTAEQNAVHAAVIGYLAERSLSLDDLSDLFTKTQYTRKSNFKTFYRDVLVAAGVNRSLDSLVHYLKRRYAYVTGVLEKGGKYTDTEDAELRRLYEVHSGVWAVIERKMGRTDLRDRWRILMREDKARESGVESKKGKWSKIEKEAFTNAVGEWINEDGLFHEKAVDWYTPLF
jgi:hypothetical protein